MARLEHVKGIKGVVCVRGAIYRKKKEGGGGIH